MTHAWTRAGVLVALLCGCTVAPSEVLPVVDLTIEGVAVVDVETGRIDLDQTIAIDKGRIVSIQPTARGQRWTGARVVNGRGRHAIPGLWDMHVHALWDPSVAESFLPAFARAGVTGVRDMGGTLPVLDQVRAASDAARSRWPRIVAAGLIVDGPEPVDPSISIAVSNEQEAVAAVERLAARGADFIKVYTLLPRDAYFAVVEQARLLGLPVAGHLPFDVSPGEAAAAGQASIEHLRDELTLLCHDDSEATCDALIEVFRAAGVHNTPTLTVLEAKTFATYRAPDALPSTLDLPAVVRAYWAASATTQASRPVSQLDARRVRFEAARALVARLARGGAPLLAGSDTGNPFIEPGVSLHRELRLLVEAGLSPRAALASATFAPARFLGHADTIGALKPGYDADIVLLDGNPLDDITNVARIAAVVLRGALLTQGKESGPPSPGDDARPRRPRPVSELP